MVLKLIFISALVNQVLILLISAHIEKAPIRIALATYTVLFYRLFIANGGVNLV